VPVGRLEESPGGGGAKRGEASRAGVAGEIVYMLSRFTDGKRDAVARLSDEEGGSKRPASSNRGVSWNRAPKSSPSAMRGLVKSAAKSSLLRPGVERKSSKGDSMGEVKNSLRVAEESPGQRMERIAWAACSSEEWRGFEAASRLTSGDVLSSMVRYSEQSEEKASFSEEGVISSNGEVRRVTVRGVGGKNVGMP
jgi:hypothetical protein